MKHKAYFSNFMITILKVWIYIKQLWSQMSSITALGLTCVKLWILSEHRCDLFGSTQSWTEQLISFFLCLLILKMKKPSLNHDVQTCMYTMVFLSASSFTHASLSVEVKYQVDFQYWEPLAMLYDVKMCMGPAYTAFWTRDHVGYRSILEPSNVSINSFLPSLSTAVSIPVSQNIFALFTSLSAKFWALPYMEHWSGDAWIYSYYTLFLETT